MRKPEISLFIIVITSFFLFTTFAQSPVTYRVLIDTDLGGDPDDIQSLYRLIHYSDILTIEGIVSTTGPGSKPRVSLIKEWIQRVDVDYLRKKGHTELITERDILNKVVEGSQTSGIPSDMRKSKGSSLIIERAHAGGKENPLWILVWGSITTLAQALFEDPTIAEKIRIHYISSSNTQNDPKSRNWVHDFMANQSPELWWIENGALPKWSHETFRGVYLGGNQNDKWGNKEFINQVIRGRGSTNNSLFNEKCGNVFPAAEWPDGILKEGDSPTLLLLLSPVLAGLGNVNDPTCESWGGQYRKPDPNHYPNYYVDLEASPDECQQTINKWRVDFLSDWEKRWKWYDD
ncbi:nucleoside hydrolase-like domain-containing protein [Bacteroidota bacterium]